MSFVETVNEVIRLAGSHQERAAVGKGKSVRELLLSPEPDAVEEYLKTLPAEDVFKLQTLMYLGRDGDDNIHEFHRAIVGTDLKPAHAIDTITSKLPLAEYLTDGLERAREMGVDLEASF